MELDFLQKTQYVTRKRHPSETPLEYSEYYDECIGMIKTGRIVDGFGKVIHDINKHEQIQKSEVISIDTYNVYNIIIEHEYGKTIHTLTEEEFNDLNIDDYKKELNFYFWDGFVKNIKVKTLKVLKGDS